MTPSAAIKVLVDYINTSSLKTAITGRVVKGDERPADSQLEDVAVNSLAMGFDQMQEGLLNVNVFIPEKKVTTGGVGIEVGDWPRIEYLESVCATVLKEVWTPNYRFALQQQRTAKDEESKQYYINNRIEFNAVNL